MNRQTLSRLGSLVAGGAVLLGLELGFGVEYYIAIPAAILAYTLLRIAFALSLDTGTQG